MRALAFGSHAASCQATIDVPARRAAILVVPFAPVRLAQDDLAQPVLKAAAICSL